MHTRSMGALVDKKKLDTHGMGHFAAGSPSHTQMRRLVKLNRENVAVVPFDQGRGWQ